MSDPAIYDAERSVQFILDQQFENPLINIARSTIEVPKELKFGDIASVQRYADLVTDRVGCTRVKAVEQSKRASLRAFYRGGEIHFPVQSGRWAMRETVVLHEIAHHITEDWEDPHGAVFAGNLLDLVETMMGPAAAFIMRVTFHQTGIEVD